MAYSNSEDFEMKVHEFDIAICTISWKFFSEVISAPSNSNFTGKKKKKVVAFRDRAMTQGTGQQRVAASCRNQISCYVLVT